MAEHNATLGDCPNCGVELPSAYLLIEYETEAGDTAIYAECPECDDVVAPET